MAVRKVIVTEIGRELECGKCKEFWPADKEFWWPSHTLCRACYLEWRAEWRKRKKAAKTEEATATA